MESVENGESKGGEMAWRERRRGNSFVTHLGALMKNGEQRGRIRSFVEAYLKKNGRLPFGGHNIDGSFIKFQTKKFL